MRICGWRNIRGQQPLASNMAKKKTAIKKTVATEPRTYVRIPLVREVDAEVGPFRDQSAAEEWLMSRGFQKLKGVAWPFKHWDKKKKNLMIGSRSYLIDAGRPATIEILSDPKKTWIGS